ncbi:hypothetical protein GCM10025864_37280 [Luteimicrobium album]|uniref:SET domain-containing protein n=1 Tax=Luteimicrobium album TaxID=1054550 RepID=A0ABQ6I8B6_9MICO|nr:SET domain-containing protein-lysine N-methyltransferase [Luteimicrobium album]GMA25969.1 hypothetical protein GCM10025864_37280 [Luteimicrobium album]
MRPGQDCWLSSSAEVRRSPIEGTGLFAVREISAGTPVARLGGALVGTQELRRLLETSATYVDTIAVGPDEHLVLPAGSPNHHGNHSCEPNLWWDGPFELVARRDIAPGEELTNDYAASTVDPDFAMTCRCGATICRETVTGSDAWAYRLDQAYDGHLVPVVLDAVAAHVT